MPSRRSCFIILISFALLSFSAGAAQVDYFLKLDGIDGESTDASHKGWIDVHSFSWGAQPAAIGPGGGCSARNVQFVVKTSKASPRLQSLSAGGTKIPSAVVEIRGERHLLQNILISSYRTNAGSPTPTETISLNFEKCATHYTPQKADGTLSNKVKAGYDIRANKEGSSAPAAPSAPSHKVIAPIDHKVPAVRLSENAALMLPNVQAPVPFVLIGLSVKTPNRAELTLAQGSQAAQLLQQAFQSQQKLPSLKVAKKGQEYMVIKFQDILISSYQTGGSGDAKVVLDFGKMEGNPMLFQDVSHK